MAFHLFRFRIAVTLILLSGAPAFCVDYQWYASEFVGDYDVNKGASLSSAGDVSFNKPEALKTVPVLWSGGGMHQLNDPNFPKVTVCDVNSSGIAVGYSTDATGDHAVIWYDGEWHLIPNMGDHWDELNEFSEELIVRPSRAVKINNNGVILGNCFVHDHNQDLFLWTPFTYEIDGSVTELARYGIYDAHGTDINESGQICVYIDALSWVFVVTGNSWQWIGGSTSLHAMNKDGRCLVNTTNPSLVYVMVPGTTWFALPSLGGANTFGYDINDNHAVGVSQDENGDYWPVIWSFDADPFSPNVTVKVIRVPSVAGPIVPLKINNDGTILMHGTYHGALYMLGACPELSEVEDQTPPTIVPPPVAPMIGESQEGYLTINAFILDDEGVDWDSVMVYVDGWYAPCGTSGGTLTCNFDHTIPWGFHTLEIYASDTSGNQTVYRVVFPTGGTDGEEPVIDEMYPQGYSATSTPHISARITDDESWPNWLMLEVYINSEPVQFEFESFYVQSQHIHIIPNGPISTGFVEIYVVDSAENPAYASWYFLNPYDALVIDAMAPTGWITESTPEITAHATNSVIGLIGWDFVQLAIDDHVIGTGGHEYNWPVDDILSYIPSEDLSEGLHTVSLAGVSWTFSVDSLPPQYSSFSMNGPKVSITITDSGSGVDWTQVHLYVDSVEVSYDYSPVTGLLCSAAALAPGSRVVAITAKDIVGNIAVDQQNSPYIEAPVFVLQFKVDEPRTPELDFRPLSNTIVASTQPVVLLNGYDRTGKDVQIIIKENEVEAGVYEDVTDIAFYVPEYGGTAIYLGLQVLAPLPYTLEVWEDGDLLGSCSFLMYYDFNGALEAPDGDIVLHHPTSMVTEDTDDGTPLTFRRDTLLISLLNFNGELIDSAAGEFLYENDLVPTGLIRRIGLVIARPRLPWASLLHHAAVLNALEADGISGVCVDYYQAEDAITEFLPDPLKDAYNQGTGSFGGMEQAQWGLFVTQSPAGVAFMKTAAPGTETTPQIGIVEAAYGEFGNTHDNTSIDRARLKKPIKFQVTQKSQEEYTVDNIVELNDGNLAGLMLNVPPDERNPRLVLPPGAGNIPRWDRRWPTTRDHGLQVLTHMAGDGTKVHKLKGTDNFMLGPAFDLKIRVLGMGGWTISHVCAAFTKFSTIPEVKVVNYSSSQWVIRTGLTSAAVSIDHEQEALLERAVWELCDQGQKILVCSAGNYSGENYSRPIDNSNAPTPYHLVPQIWGGSNPRIVVVGATDNLTQTESFADFMSNSGPEIRILAPGVLVPAINRNGGGPALDLTAGTSFSSPFVAGVIGQLTRYSMGNPMKAVEIATATADTVTVPQGINVTNKRINFWKAAITAANGHLSSQNGRNAGAVDGFSHVQAKNHDDDTLYYGFEIRTNEPKASVWLRTKDENDEFVYTPLGDGPDTLPIDFEPAPGEDAVFPAVTYAGVPADVFVPKGAGKYVVCVSISRSELRLDDDPLPNDPKLIVAKGGDDPRATPNFQPIITMPVDAGSLQTLRMNANFSNFVFKLEE